MPVVIDEVTAEIAPEPQPAGADDARRQAPAPDTAALAVRAIEREFRRLHRLSDR